MKIHLTLVLLLIVALTGCKQEDASSSNQISIPDLPPIQLDTKPNPNRPASIPLVEGGVSRTVFEPTIIDTTKFEKQIARSKPYEGELLTASMFRPQDPVAPEIQPGEPNNLQPMGGITNLNRVKQQMNFPGISQARFTPPDPTLAVGPNHIVQMVNSEIAWFTKDGTMQFQNTLDSTGSPGFFETVGAGDFCVDPRCFYDHYANRFVVMCLEVYFGIDESYLTIAVSDDDDPNGIWYKYRPWGVFRIGNTDYWADYPSFGFDANGYYISGNLFSFGFSQNGVGIRTMDKTPFLTGQAITVNDIFNTSFSTVQMAQNFGSNSTPYGVAFNTSTSATIIAINDPLGTPSISTSNVSIAGFSGSGNVNNAGGSVSTVGGRSMNAHWRDGNLYTCHSVDGGGRALVRWYQIDVGDWPTSGPAPTLDQSGDINLGAGQSTFFPSIYSNSNGNVSIVFANCSSTELISVKAAGRLASDPPGTMSAPTQFALSSRVANGRYGDYFDIGVDPLDGTTFWMTGETSESFGWDTVINSFVIETELTVSPNNLAVDIGSVNSGGVPELEDSDDEYVVLDPEFLTFRYQLRFTVDATSPSSAPSALEFSYESRAFNFVGTVDQEIELFNYDSGQFETIDTRLTTATDTTVSVTPGGDPSRFVQAGTNAMQTRISYENSLPFWVFSTQNLYLPYRVRADQIFWTITP